MRAWGISDFSLEQPRAPTHTQVGGIPQSLWMSGPVRSG